MQHFVFKQQLPITLEEAWAFFSNPYNLNKITPPAMNFRVVRQLPEKIYEGMFIEYMVSPLAGIPLEWVTEITHVESPKFFIDEQRKGPYLIWHHEHHFAQTNNGVEMTDKLYYSVPFGVFGKILDRIVINKKVRGIFEFRRKALNTIFGGPNLSGNRPD